MKKVFPVITALLLTAALSIVSFGCSGSSSKESSGSGKTQPAASGSSFATTAAETEPETEADPFTAEYKDTIITYKYCELLTDDYGTTALYVYFDFTNNSDEKQAFYTTFSTKIYEDGIELDDIVVSMVDSKAHDNYSADIKPGVTAEVAAVFAVPENFPVTLEVEPWISFKDNILLSLEIQP